MANFVSVSIIMGFGKLRSSRRDSSNSNYADEGRRKRGDAKLRVPNVVGFHLFELGTLWPRTSFVVTVPRHKYLVFLN